MCECSVCVSMCVCGVWVSVCVGAWMGRCGYVSVWVVVWLGLWVCVCLWVSVCAAECESGWVWECGLGGCVWMCIGVCGLVRRRLVVGVCGWSVRLLCR